jgi:hypothetical protein
MLAGYHWRSLSGKPAPPGPAAQVSLIIQPSFIMTGFDLRAVRSCTIWKVHHSFVRFAASLGRARSGLCLTYNPQSPIKHS